MTDKPYPNVVLTDICTQLLDAGLTPEQIGNLAMDIAGECEAIAENRAEAAWEARISRDPDDSAFRRDMIAAGRGLPHGRSATQATRSTAIISATSTAP